MNPPSCFENEWGLWDGCKKPKSTHVNLLAPSPSMKGSRLKTARCSGQPARTTPVHPPPTHTRLFVQHLLLWHCSPLRQRPQLPTSVNALGRNGASLGPSPALSQGRDCHWWCVHMCMLLGGNRTEEKVKPTQKCILKPSGSCHTPNQVGDGHYAGEKPIYPRTPASAPLTPTPSPVG